VCFARKAHIGDVYDEGKAELVLLEFVNEVFFDESR
jgi:hypothetical protein